MTERNLVDIAGWIGVVAILIAYGLVSMKRMEGDSVRYQALNIIGAGLLIYNSYYFQAYPSVVVNLVWVIIGMYTMVHKSFKARNK